ncbi:MAG: YitT family protein [Solobacterium sp.]|nr:YitT family protein [Solobacterium sp.]
MKNLNLPDLIQIFTGTLILAVSVVWFIIPYNILSGGVAGIAVALEPLLHLNKMVFANVLVIVLLGAGTMVLGKQFFLTTALSSLLYPVFTSLLSRTAYIPQIDPVLASFYGGLLGGVGIGIVMRTGASTGGMDIPPMIIHKLTGMKINTLVMITDGLTVLLGLSLYGIEEVLVGMISVFASSYAIGKVLTFGSATSKSVQIISREWQKITTEINMTFERGATVFDAIGSYSGEPKKVILVVVSERQYNHLIDTIKSIDPTAFIITTDAADMHGEGFTYGARI